MITHRIDYFVFRTVSMPILLAGLGFSYSRIQSANSCSASYYQRSGYTYPVILDASLGESGETCAVLSGSRSFCSDEHLWKQNADVAFQRSAIGTLLPFQLRG